MRIVIRNQRDHSRFVGRRGWVLSARRGRHFPSAQAAIHFCLEHDLTDAEVFVRFDERSAPVIVKIPDELREIAAGEEWQEADHRVIA